MLSVILRVIMLSVILRVIMPSVILGHYAECYSESLCRLLY
jgi:hypothetical protein